MNDDGQNVSLTICDVKYTQTVAGYTEKLST